MKRNTFKKGFTLIELLIVITIIGILAAALLPSILGTPARARDTARKADLGNISKAVETFAADHQHYPSVGGCIEDVDDATINAPGVLNTYFSGNTPPKDPQGKPAGAACNKPGGYVYCPLSGSGYSYLLASFVEEGNSGNGKASDIADTCNTGTPPTLSGQNSGDAADPNIYVIRF